MAAAAAATTSTRAPARSGSGRFPLRATFGWLPSGRTSGSRKRPSCSTAGGCGTPLPAFSGSGRRRTPTMGDFTGLVLFVLFGAVFFYILYGVIRAAVRDGIGQADERRRRRATEESDAVGR